MTARAGHCARGGCRRRLPSVPLLLLALLQCLLRPSPASATSSAARWLAVLRARLVPGTAAAAASAEARDGGADNTPASTAARTAPPAAAAHAQAAGAAGLRPGAGTAAAASLLPRPAAAERGAIGEDAGAAPLPLPLRRIDAASAARSPDGGDDDGGGGGGGEASPPSLPPPPLLPHALYHGWPCPLPGCNVSGYDVVTPTVIGGVFPHLTSDWLPCAAWKLAATICTTPPAAYEPGGDAVEGGERDGDGGGEGGGSGGGDAEGDRGAHPSNWYCPRAGGFDDPLFGSFCGPVVGQYICSGSPGHCNAGPGGDSLLFPLSLRDCRGAEVAQRARLKHVSGGQHVEGRRRVVR